MFGKRISFIVMIFSLRVAFPFNQKLGDSHLSVADLKDQLQRGNESLGNKIHCIVLWSIASWHNTMLGSEGGGQLRALIQYKIIQGDGLPYYFSTGSCAEFHFKPLH